MLQKYCRLNLDLSFFFYLYSSFSRRDPLYKVCDNIINEVVRESTTELVHSAVNDLVVGHMTVIKAGDWLEDFILETIQPMLPRVVRVFLCVVNSCRKSLINSNSVITCRQNLYCELIKRQFLQKTDKIEFLRQG